MFGLVAVDRLDLIVLLRLLLRGLGRIGLLQPQKTSSGTLHPVDDLRLACTEIYPRSLSVVAVIRGGRVRALRPTRGIPRDVVRPLGPHLRGAALSFRA